MEFLNIPLAMSSQIHNVSKQGNVEWSVLPIKPGVWFIPMPIMEGKNYATVYDVKLFKRIFEKELLYLPMIGESYNQCMTAYEFT